jgi:hypothetical protein
MGDIKNYVILANDDREVKDYMEWMFKNGNPFIEPIKVHGPREFSGPDWRLFPFTELIKLEGLSNIHLIKVGTWYKRKLDEIKEIEAMVWSRNREGER